ncbi:MAG: hypothetical protein RJA24_2050 [Pseudomonadota bacterium]|jgi:hypothetical protein
MTISRSLWVFANWGVAAHQPATSLRRGFAAALREQTIGEVAVTCKPVMRDEA